MNLTDSSPINKYSANFDLAWKRRGRHYFLYLVSLYTVLVFNEFIKRPVDFFALALILFGSLLINRDNIKSLKESISHSYPLKLVFLGLLAESTLFFVATLKQPTGFGGLIAFTAQYGVHIALAVIALLVIPLNVKSTLFLFNSLLLALLALVLVDIGFYVWDVKNGIAIGSDYRHRWFGDGYVFMTPFLLAMILSNKGLASHGVAKKCLVAAAFLQPALYLLLAVVVLLCGGTGARSTYLVLVCEILFFFILKTRHHGWSWVKILVMSLILLGTLKFAFGFLAPQMLDGAISRGFRIWDRVLYAWGPGILLTSEAPIFGHGFGAAAWDSAFAHLQLNHPEIINFGSPHNWFLAAAFFGGVTALLAQVLLAIGILLFTVRFLARDNQLIKIHLLNNKLDYVCIAVLMSFICFYLIRGLVEFTIYKYMGVLIIIVGLLSVVEENNKK